MERVSRIKFQKAMDSLTTPCLKVRLAAAQANSQLVAYKLACKRVEILNKLSKPATDRCFPGERGRFVTCGESWSPGLGDFRYKCEWQGCGLEVTIFVFADNN